MSVLRKLRQAMTHHDRWVVRCEYTDQAGNTTIRIISPIRLAGPGPDRVVALCLGREEPRQFVLSRMSTVELVLASSVQMPEPVEEI